MQKTSERCRIIEKNAAAKRPKHVHDFQKRVHVFGKHEHVLPDSSRRTKCNGKDGLLLLPFLIGTNRKNERKYRKPAKETKGIAKFSNIHFTANQHFTPPFMKCVTLLRKYDVLNLLHIYIYLIFATRNLPLVERNDT